MIFFTEGESLGQVEIKVVIMRVTMYYAPPPKKKLQWSHSKKDPHSPLREWFFTSLLLTLGPPPSWTPSLNIPSPLDIWFFIENYNGVILLKNSVLNPDNPDIGYINSVTNSFLTVYHAFQFKDKQMFTSTLHLDIPNSFHPIPLGI